MKISYLMHWVNSGQPINQRRVRSNLFADWFSHHSSQLRSFWLITELVAKDIIQKRILDRTALQIQFSQSKTLTVKKNTTHFSSLVWTSVRYQKFQDLLTRLQELYLYCICNAFLLCLLNCNVTEVCVPKLCIWHNLLLALYIIVFETVK